MMMRSQKLKPASSELTYIPSRWRRR